MQKLLSRRLVLTLLSAWLCAIPIAQGNQGNKGHKQSGFNPSEASIGPDQAAAMVRARTGGRVLGVRAVSRGEWLYYRVKVLKSGYVRIYRVDAKSGAVAE